MASTFSQAQRRKRFALITLIGIAATAILSSKGVAQNLQGLDLSSFQGDISQATWNNMKNVQGKQFGFVRASRGATFGPIVPPGTDQGAPYNRFDDRFFVNNITRGTNAGMLMGSYHFNRADIAGNTGADEANHYMETGFEQPAGHTPQYAGNFMRPGYLLPVFDLEAGSGLSNAALTAWSNEFIDTIYNAKGFYPIVYTNSSYNNDEVAASVAWFNVDNGAGPHTGLKTYQWVARPAGDIVNGDPGAATNYPNPYGVWDANFNSRTNSRDPAVDPWSFWQNGTFVISGGANGSADRTAANGNIEYVKDFLVPALWTGGGSGDWSTVANWNSNNPLRDADPSNVAMGPVSRLPNNLDWVQLRNAGGGTVTLSTGAHTVRKLTTQQPLNITGGSLTVAYVPGSGGRDDLPADFAGSVTLANSAAYTARTTQVDGGGGQFNVNGGTLTFSEIQLASHASNPGKLVIGGDATFAQTGGAGTSVIRSTGALGQAGSVSLPAGNRTFNVANGSASVDLNVRAPVTGAGRLVKSGPGTMQLSNTPNSYAGGTTISEGVLQIADNRLGAVPSGPQADNIILDGGTLRVGTEINSIILNSPGSGYTSFPTLAINGAGPNSLPASANVLAGITSIAVASGGSGYVNQSLAPVPGSAGTFVDVVGGGGSGATARANVSGGVVTGVTITSAGNGYTSMPTIHISSTAIGGVAGSGATANVSGITLQSIATNDSGFDYANATVSLTGGGGSGAIALAALDPSTTLHSHQGIMLTANGGTLDQTAGTTFTVNGPISSSGNGALTKAGSGTLVLFGATSYVGDTIVQAGTLSLANATLSDAADLHLATGSLLDLTFSGGPDAIDQLFIDGVAQTAGVWGGVGSAAQFTTPLITGMGLLQVGSPAPIPGDFNGNGTVESTDLTAWQNGFGLPNGANAANGDGDADGDVDGNDFLVWQQNLGMTQSTATSTANSAAVPEPTAAALMLLAIGGLIGRRASLPCRG